MFVEEKTSDNLQELKTKREALGLSLEDVFQRTRIRVAYLQAMENNDFHLLPTSAYSKNFIKTYARTLGIDSKPILIKYEDYLNSRKILQSLPPEGASNRKLLFTKIANIKIYWGIAAILIVIGTVIWLISKQYQSSSDIISSANKIITAVQENKEQTTNVPVNAIVPVSEQKKADSNSVLNEVDKKLPVKTQSISTKEENNAENTLKEKVPLPVENLQAGAHNEDTSLLIISAIEKTWIRIKADQNPSFQVLLKPGEKFERKAVSFEMDIGNAGGIKIQFKGKNIEKLGESGQVVHLRLP